MIGAFLGKAVVYFLNQSSVITGFGANGFDAGSAVFQGAAALNQVWVFIVGPFIGAAIAVGLYKLFYNEGASTEAVKREVVTEEERI